MFALIHLANLELIFSVIVPESYAQLVRRIVYDGLVGASDEALLLQRLLRFLLLLLAF